MNCYDFFYANSYKKNFSNLESFTKQNKSSGDQH